MHRFLLIQVKSDIQVEKNSKERHIQGRTRKYGNISNPVTKTSVVRTPLLLPWHTENRVTILQM